jgi:ribosome maturation factor RimP
VEEKLGQLLAEKFAEEDFKDFFLVEIKYNAAKKKLEVFVDSDNSMTIEQSAQINRYLQQHIDENGWLGETYTLDVSSPGVGNPLKLHRQYVKNIGRNVVLKLVDNTEKEGLLTAVSEEGITIEYENIIKEEKKKRKEKVEAQIVWAAIQEAVVTIKF